jgi:hypothetical protein
MSLALVTVTSADFDFIYAHLRSHAPTYQNMHLREACQRNKKRDLRYLHAMRPKPGDAKVIEGMISGPGVLWEYALIRTRTGTQWNVMTNEAPPRQHRRIGAQFLKEVMKRIREEKAGFDGFPSRTRGQYYLRRHATGTPINHPTCKRAIADRVLDERFLATVLPWGFQLLCP